MVKVIKKQEIPTVYCRGRSIMVEQKHLKPVHIDWLDNCGAKWANGDKFSEYKPKRGEIIVFYPKCKDQEGYEEKGEKDVEWVFHPTWPPYASYLSSSGDSFCRRVATQLGLGLPPFIDPKKATPKKVLKNCKVYYKE